MERRLLASEILHTTTLTSAHTAVDGPDDPV